MEAVQNTMVMHLEKLVPKDLKLLQVVVAETNNTRSAQTPKSKSQKCKSMAWWPRSG